jgi:hypothetical protein
MTLSRGRIAVENNQLSIERGTGEFLARTPSETARPPGLLEPEMDRARNFGADLLPETQNGC